MISTAQPKVAGIITIETPCPKCQSRMFQIPCKCPQRRQGWAICAKCFNPKCGTIVGIKKRREHRGRRIRNPFGL
jgi:hypothetical protein